MEKDRVVLLVPINTELNGFCIKVLCMYNCRDYIFSLFSLVLFYFTESNTFTNLLQMWSSTSPHRSRTVDTHDSDDIYQCRHYLTNECVVLDINTTSVLKRPYLLLRVSSRLVYLCQQRVKYTINVMTFKTLLILPCFFFQSISLLIFVGKMDTLTGHSLLKE